VAKKAVSIFILFVFCFANTTCKKVSKYPIRLNGVWYAPSSRCGMMITIDNSGNGDHSSASSDKGCDNGGEKGKVKFTKHKLYIGNTHYKFLTEPQLNTNSDSILAPRLDNVFLFKKFKVLATMKLRDSFINGKDENIYYKYIEY